MRRAMARAAVGDDDYGEDPAVNELQRRAAATLGTESTLFVPTATMANLIAVMCHCQRREAQLFPGQDAHLHVYEHGGTPRCPLPWAQVAGVHSQALPDLTIREAHGSQYHPRPELICLENTHSSAGGRALPLPCLRQVRGLADRNGLRVHMDGARLMNAAVAQGVEPAQIAQHCDSVSLCFSKGLGALAGAVLAWSGQLVAEAWRVRKPGRGMRQAGVLAAAAELGLQHAEGTLHREHQDAWSFAEGIQVLHSPLCSISLAAVETNIVMENVQGAWPSLELCEEEEAESGQAVSVLLLPGALRRLGRHTELARRKLEFVARKCQEDLALGLHAVPPGTGGA
ncbi:LOW QUALITY PROTEIN: uncharacterized protein GJ701_013050 [Geothlypis trichas]